MGSAFHQLCPRYSGTLTPTAPTALSYGTPLPFTFLLHYHGIGFGVSVGVGVSKMLKFYVKVFI